MKGLPVVSSQEMARLDRMAKSIGCSEERFVEEAGRQVAAIVMRYVETHHLPKKVVLLIGKGNKGADAYRAGYCLLDEGYEVRAIQTSLGKHCSELNQKMEMRFREKRGHVELMGLPIDFQADALIVDGLVGTGFKGEIEGVLEGVIQKANRSGKPILSIDIPSGLDGTTGQVKPIALHAQETVALGLAKIGCFLNDGWNHVGRLHVADFGLPKEIVAKAEGVAFLPDWKQLRLPKIIRTRHKYQAGYVVGFGGSKELPGAPKMSGMAALHAGAGIVRLFHPEEIGPVPFELIFQPLDSKGGKKGFYKSESGFHGSWLGKNQRNRELVETTCAQNQTALRH